MSFLDNNNLSDSDKEETNHKFEWLKRKHFILVGLAIICMVNNIIEVLVERAEGFPWMSFQEIQVSAKAQVDYEAFRNMTGSWIGNMWIPPEGWKLFSTREMQQFYSDKRMLWIGDSTGRRAFATFYAILNATSLDDVNVSSVNDWQVIDVNKKHLDEPCPLFKSNGGHHPELCRANPYHDHKGSDDRSFMMYIRENCLGDARYHAVSEFVIKELSVTTNSSSTSTIATAMPNASLIANTSAIVNASSSVPLMTSTSYTSDSYERTTTGPDVIVVSMGIWDSMNKCTTEKPFDSLVEETLLHMDEMLRARQSKPLDIVWRTSGYHLEVSMGMDFVEHENKIIMDTIDKINRRKEEICSVKTGISTIYCRSNLIYVNWGGAVKARSFDNNRIVGDLKAHYGLEPRLVLSQMITNALANIHEYDAYRSNVLSQ